MSYPRRTAFPLLLGGAALAVSACNRTSQTQPAYQEMFDVFGDLPKLYVPRNHWFDEHPTYGTEPVRGDRPPVAVTSGMRPIKGEHYSFTPQNNGKNIIVVGNFDVGHIMTADMAAANHNWFFSPPVHRTRRGVGLLYERTGKQLPRCEERDIILPDTHAPRFRVVGIEGGRITHDEVLKLELDPTDVKYLHYLNGYPYRVTEQPDGTIALESQFHYGIERRFPTYDYINRTNPLRLKLQRC